MTAFVRATGTASDEQRTRAALGWRFEEMQTELYNRAQDLQEANRSLREAVAELAAKEEQLRIAHEAKDRFLAVLSHELRNPLSAIRGALDVLADTVPYRGQREQMMHRVIERQTNALTRMTDDLLDISRAQVGKLELNRNRVDLGELVGAVVSSIETSEGVGARRIETRLPDSAMFVDGDPIRLRQAIANLLGNAVKFTQPAGRIEIDVRDADGIACVSVRDDGQGFEPSRAGELFEPFAQADSSLARTTAGLGLGLPIVRNIVELHGGQVTGHSDGPGQGACFTIELPAAPGPAPKRPPQEPVLRRGTGARVLVIEDDRDVATAYVALLERLGHQAIARRVSRRLPQCSRMPCYATSGFPTLTVTKWLVVCAATGGPRTFSCLPHPATATLPTFSGRTPDSINTWSSRFRASISLGPCRMCSRTAHGAPRRPSPGLPRVPRRRRRTRAISRLVARPPATGRRRAHPPGRLVSDLGARCRRARANAAPLPTVPLPLGTASRIPTRTVPGDSAVVMDDLRRRGTGMPTPRVMGAATNHSERDPHHLSVRRYACRVRRSPEVAMNRSWPAVPQTPTYARRAVIDFAEGAGANGEELDAVQLAVSEAVTNAVMHAYRDCEPGLVHVSAALAGDELWVLVADDGCGLSPREDSPGAGYGLRLIAQAADQLTVVRRGDGGTELQMRFDLENPGRDTDLAPEVSTGERKPRSPAHAEPSGWA